MLENFREIYNKEFNNSYHENPLEYLIFNSTEVRAFVYEVCKGCVMSQQDNMVKTESITQPEIEFCETCGTALGG